MATPEKPHDQPIAAPPETLEGWYVLHQVLSFVPNTTSERVQSTHPDISSAGESAEQSGWTAYVRLIGSKSSLMALHFGPTLESIGRLQQQTVSGRVIPPVQVDYSFLSVTEAGLYHLTAQLAAETAARGGTVGDEIYVAELAKRAAAERENPRVKTRLYPALPEGMPYVCFYPMDKRRDAGQNWYTLTLAERSRLMQTHGMTGRRYAGRVVQVISGAIGFDAWEWGVTLFAKDPLDFKKLVTDMRFDEVSAKYAEFGDFYVGKLIAKKDIAAYAETPWADVP